MAKGRPRAFDVNQALDRALQVFWRQGYEGSSLADLTQAMGINPPSLYAAFGNKVSLFRETLDRYVEGPAAYTRTALDAPTARAVAERLLQGAIDLLSDKRHPRGCLLVQGALACGETAEEVRHELIARRLAGQAAIRKRFQRAKREGDLPAGADPADLARYISTVLEGMAIEAAGGASREQLQRLAELTLRAWPI
jgi:AcrR family transcriptional regulator